MRIGIDCRLWDTSTGRYIRENVKRLAKLDSKNEYVLFMFSDDMDEFDPPENFKIVEANIPWHSFSEQLIFPLIVLKEKLDIFHVPYFNVPIFYPKKFVATIHDLTILRVNTGRASTRAPWIYWIKKQAFKLALNVAVKRSQKIITVSEYVKKDIIDTFEIAPDKVEVIYNGVDDHFKEEPNSKVLQVSHKYKVTKPYLFYVGNAHPHKNVGSLIEAFVKVMEVFPDLQLVLAGKSYYFYDRLEKEWKDHSIYKKLVFTGFISDEDLPSLYSGAEAFVNPSLMEGFGLQLLEAFACGTKVICSNTTSLPEVGGEAAYYFDPENVEDMAGVVVAALKDPIDAKKELGYERILKFSWDVAARRHLVVYKESYK